MTLQDAINSGKPYKRKRNKVWIDPDNDSSFAMRDVLASDWEIKNDPPNYIRLYDNKSGELSFEGGVSTIQGDVIFLDVVDNWVSISEKEVDQILTFLYHNSDIGKKRIIPF
jgi:hypothetical protein